MVSDFHTACLFGASTCASLVPVSCCSTDMQCAVLCGQAAGFVQLQAGLDHVTTMANFQAFRASPG
jgi:hypothetical protein